MLKDKMSSGGKQKLRPWLEEKISRGDVPGLYWLNDERSKFRIPWKHGGKQDWSPDNSRIFMEWAKHTGKYREGVDDPSYPTWKTRLRCAFNKAPDIQEVKEESQLNGHEPFRVYILTQGKRVKLDVKGQKGNGRGGGVGGGRKGDEEEEEEESGYCSALKTEFSSNVAETADASGIPTMVSDFDDCSSPADEEGLSPDLESLSPCDFLTPDTTRFMMQEVGEEEGGVGLDCQFDGTFPSDASTGEPTTTTFNYLQGSTSGDTFLTLLQNNDDCKIDQPNPPHKKDFRIKLELFYCGQQVFRDEINIKSGVRLAVSGCATSLRPDFAILPADVEALLAKNPLTVYLPLCGNLLNSQRLEPMVNHLLTKSLSQGLLLWMDDDCDIFAFRFCPGAIYHISQTETNGKPVKIPLNKDRPEVVRIFRYADGYRKERDRYAAGQRPDAPEATVYLSFGEPANADAIPERVYVCAKITPMGLDDEGLSLGQESLQWGVGMVNDVEMDDPYLYNVGCSIGGYMPSIPCDMEEEVEDNDDDEADDDDDDDEDEGELKRDGELSRY